MTTPFQLPSAREYGAWAADTVLGGAARLPFIVRSALDPSTYERSRSYSAAQRLSLAPMRDALGAVLSDAEQRYRNAHPFAGRVAAAADSARSKDRSLMPLEFAAPGPSELFQAMPMALFHGSPHRFTKFRHADEVARTGQGANSYGHGIYLAENPEVARSYHASVKPNDSNTRYAREMRERIASRRPLGMDGIEADAPDEVYRARLQELDDYINRNDGGVYRVTGDFDPEDLLDWDAPLSGQPKHVIDAVKQIEPLADMSQNAGSWFRSLGPKLRVRTDRALANRNAPTLRDRWLGDQGSVKTPIDPIDRLLLENIKSPNPLSHEQMASKIMGEMGIPGLRYLDQGSRRAGHGTRNVVWWGDPEKLRIEGTD